MDVLLKKVYNGEPIGDVAGFSKKVVFCHQFSPGWVETDLLFGFIRCYRMNVRKNTVLVTIAGTAYLFVTVIVITVRAAIPTYSFQILRIAGLTFTIAGLCTKSWLRLSGQTRKLKMHSATTFGHLPIGGVLKKETKVAQTSMTLIIMGFTLQLYGNLG